VRERIDDLGGRRFLLSFASLFVSSALLMGGYISDSIYRDIVIATVAVYIAGNTTQKVKEGMQ
jgi:hypothetical protein